MSLKELTKENHRAAERTAFMQALLKRKLSEQMWKRYTRNKMLWYGAIEAKASFEGLFDGLPDLYRSYRIYQDYQEMSQGEETEPFLKSALEYQKYILNLEPGKVMAHVYTWHMGDLFGGQRIKELIPWPTRSLTFSNVEEMKQAIRSKIDDSMADEANCAFEWAIKIMEECCHDMDHSI